MTSHQGDGYVNSIRRTIGQSLLLLPGVAVLVTDSDGQILMVEQSDRQCWSTVGGAIEPRESPVDAAVREALEETGLHVDVDSLVGVAGGPGYDITYPNGDECSYVSIVYRAHVIGGTLTPDGREVLACRWVDPRDLGALNLSPFTRNLMTELALIPRDR